MSTTSLLTVAVLGVIGFRVATGTRLAFTGDGRRRVLFIVRGLRLRNFLMAVPVLIVVLTAVVILVQLPVLSFGWWTALGGAGSPVVGATDKTAGSALEWVIPAVFIALLVPALPLFAEAEERLFRWGSEHRTFWGRAWKGVQFGLLHAVIGIPIGAALGLSIGGWYFTWVYMQAYNETKDPAAATVASTRAHLAYNVVVVTIIIVVLTLLPE